MFIVNDSSQTVSQALYTVLLTCNSLLTCSLQLYLCSIRYSGIIVLCSFCIISGQELQSTPFNLGTNSAYMTASLFAGPTAWKSFFLSCR